MFDLDQMPRRQFVAFIIGLILMVGAIFYVVVPAAEHGFDARARQEARP